MTKGIGMGIFYYAGSGTVVGPSGVKVSVGEHKREAAVLVVRQDGSESLHTPAELAKAIDAAARVKRRPSKTATAGGPKE